MSDTVQQIKDRLNIVEVIQGYVKLTKAGKNYKGLSPFKKEKTPSFYVNPDKGMYYDFSSGQGGDMFTFVQQMEGLDFKGALRLLAERAGVELTYENPTMRDARDRLYHALDAASRFYEGTLADEHAAREYLTSRGIAEHTMRSFRLGFAPPLWRSLLEHLTHEGFSQIELESAGLIKRSERGYYDRFRSRIMFPIMDASGRVIAFSGRIFGEAASDEKNAKYLNSPETPLFDKGRTLYGYDKAKQVMRKHDFAIIVEGQMDLVLSHQAGFGNTVAASGTGLTEHHLALIERLTKRIVLAFDADSAGVASTGRAAALALPRGMDVKVAHVKIGKDPADCILADPEVWRESVREAKHVVELFLDRAVHADDDAPYDARKAALSVRDTVLPLIASIPSGVDQAYFVRRVAERLSLPEDALWRDVRALPRTEQSNVTPPHAAADIIPSPRMRSKREDLEARVAGFVFWQGSLESRVLEEEHIRAMIDRYAIAIEPILAKFSEERETLAFESELIHDGVDPYTTFETLVKALALFELKEERARLTRELREAEHQGDADATTSILDRFRALSRRIDALER